MKKPLVSIGLIAYGRGQILHSAIESLLAQSYSHFELIISDDASTDTTATVCKKYAHLDKRIRFYRQKNNLGLPQNSNFVLHKAKGKYFMWASDDDIWHKNFVENLVHLLDSNPRSVLAMSAYMRFNGRKKEVVNYSFPRSSMGAELIRTYFIERPLLVWGLFNRRALLDAGGFHIDKRPFLYGGSDNITVFRTLFKGNFMYTQKVLFYKRDSGYAMRRFEIVENLAFSNEIISKIKRYLLYPVMFFCDQYYIYKIIRNSALSFREKTIVFVYATFNYVIINLHFISQIVLGIMYVGRGILKKLWLSFRSTKKYRTSSE